MVPSIRIVLARGPMGPPNVSMLVFGTVVVTYRGTNQR